MLKLAVPTPTLPPFGETNTYVVCDGGRAVVIDCGAETPEAAADVLAELQRLGIQSVAAYVATHHHVDHTRGLGLLSASMPAPIYIHPLDHAAARQHVRDGTVDLRVAPTAIQLSGVEIRLLHCPGHTRGHLHVWVLPDNALVVGDHLAGTGSVWIGPPDGHMGDYYASLKRVEELAPEIALPGHGDAISDPAQASRALLERRLLRERQIVDALADGPLTVDELVDIVYRGRELGPALEFAKRTIFAHLEHLSEQGSVGRSTVAPDLRTRYHRILEEESLT